VKLITLRLLWIWADGITTILRNIVVHLTVSAVSPEEEPVSRWKHPDPMSLLAEANRGTAMETLGIEITGIDEDGIRGTMPVDHRHKQPAGLLHGGITCVLAETLGSYGSWLLVDGERYTVVGQQISCNHLRPVTGGTVSAYARTIHVGKRSHLWDISVYDESGRLTATSRLTVAVVDRR
jgi:1,4-dihydroxy-2-naphthoyl-CoA hydrolase